MGLYENHKASHKIINEGKLISIYKFATPGDGGFNIWVPR